jgi:two-component system, NarL family, response regulator DevR
MTSGPFLPTVLLVEDSVPVRRQLAALLRGLGVVDEIGEAGSVDQALKRIATGCPDVIVLDMNLGARSGMEVPDELRTRQGRRPLTIVLTNRHELRESCLDAGADYFFDKTREFSTALDTIRNIARPSRAD